MLTSKKYMTQVAKLSSRTLVLLTLAAIFASTEIFPLGAPIFAWMAGIQIFNTLAPKLPFSHLIHWMHAMTFELLALAGVPALRFIPLGKKVHGQGKPILLVHGYINHSSVWFLFKKQLRALGFGPIYTINLGHPFKSIREYALKVKEKAEEIAKETGQKQLTLIGHSMGGLVSCYYAAKLAPKDTVTDVVTIASPLSGTWVAHIGIGPNAREMRPSSELLKELKNEMLQRKDIRFFNIGTRTDQLVIPSSSAIIPENKNFIFEDIGHASLLYSKRSAAQIASWLSV
jgi:triacylglycerol esterase/lipase EstA (alpha/beta hydrolase family)